MRSVAALAVVVLINAVLALNPFDPVSVAVADDDSSTTTPKPAAMNVKNYDVTPQVFHDVSYRALVRRGWTVETNESTRLIGSRKNASGSETYKVEIRFADDIISISYVEGFQKEYQRSWLKKLAKDIKGAIQPYRKGTTVAPPAAPQ